MMTYAYDRNLLYKAQITLGWMFDYGVNEYGLSIEEFFSRFISSGIASKYERGEPSIVAGHSGGELAYMVLADSQSNLDMIGQVFKPYRSREYWLGYVLAYYQWKNNLSFEYINEIVPVADMLLLYDKYHEMDVESFVELIDEKRKEYQKVSQLKRLRTYAKLSQSKLAIKADIPVRTLQQYEQGQKDLAHANAEYIIRLADALGVTPKDIIRHNVHSAEYHE